MIAAYNMVQLCVVKATMRLSNAITLYYDDKTNNHKTKKNDYAVFIIQEDLVRVFEQYNNTIIIYMRTLWTINLVVVV